VQGRAEVAARFARTAGGYAGGGGASTSDNLARWVGAELACTVDLEHHQTRLDGQAVTFTYRVTHVFRREAGAWKVVLRHADPLATFRGPEFAHAGAVAER
jgi:ketosteroid isomerase-like protein